MTMKRFLPGLLVILLFSLAQAQENGEAQADDRAQQQKNDESAGAPKEDRFEPSEKIVEDHPAIFPADI